MVRKRPPGGGVLVAWRLHRCKGYHRAFTAFLDGRGKVYVNTINFDFAEFNEVLTSGKAPGKIALVTPDGEAREVANELAFPNGMVITPDNKTLVVAESFAARLTAFDIEDDGSLANRRV
jgi:sugar lactone lactonase YvrE